MNREGMTFLSLAAVLLTFFIYLNSLAHNPQKSEQPLLENPIQAKPEITLPFQQVFIKDLSIRSDAINALYSIQDSIRNEARTKLEVQLIVPTNENARLGRHSVWQESLLASGEITRLFLDLGLSSSQFHISTSTSEPGQDGKVIIRLSSQSA